MSGRSSPMYEGLAARPDEWDVVLKVKYGETLKRFNGYVQGPQFSLNLSALRSKIASAFKFDPNIDFILTYTDEDGDIVMLDDDDDLHDAAIHQKLNPLRINVQLNSSHTAAPQAKQQDSNNTPLRPTTIEDPLTQIKSVIEEVLKPISYPLRSTAQEDRLSQVKSAIDEAIKSIQEPVPDALAKLSHEVLEAAPPHIAELIKPFVKLVTPSNNQPSNGRTDGSSSSTGLPQTQADLKTNEEPKIDTSLVSGPLDKQNSKSSGARGLKTVPVEAPATLNVKSSQGRQSSLYPSIEELLFSTNLTNSAEDKSISKGINDAQSKGKSVMTSDTPPAPPAPVFRPAPPIQSPNGWSQLPARGSTFHPSIWQSEADSKANSDSRWRLPLYRAGTFRPHTPLSHVPPQVPPAPMSYGHSPHFPYPGRLLSSNHLHGDLANKTESSPVCTFHRWIQCDGCGVQPIPGPRYKSKTKEDYDLCGACFHRMGNEVEYTRIDKPLLPQRLVGDSTLCRKIHSRAAMKSKREKLESRFILDVTVLDGTLMAPSTPFTKIWRMHNNGSITWPLGTQLIWVGGDQFALQTSVPLEIPVNGFPVDQEIDVAVDFVAPGRPGRYISYWRLASPSGQKFGQRVWVHIQVEDPSFVSNNRTAAINLNLPPESNNTNTNLIDVNIEPVDQVFGQHVNSRTKELLEQLIHREIDEPENPEPAPLPVPLVSSTASLHPIIDVDVPSSSTPAAFVPDAVVPPPEPAVSPVPPTVNVPPGNAPASAGASTSDHYGINNLTEEKLLKELEEMGFRQVDLNKEILRQNKYNLEQSVDDLCGVSEWDPLLAELQEMGFDDSEINKEVLAKNGGSIKRAVMDLIAREKKDQ
ncbi:protein JOKA2 [Oryza brachyantha]|uniref:protein JOKA2 n=1 Tax=Oryza brachyantha TaxID=4533 RepID=UPI0003EA990C|nr:protein JOKA2 [Oryza brachyantha]